jgi:hypothetical protein
VFIVIWILLVGWSSYHHGFWKGWLILITIPAGVLVLEILLRAVMRITYGKNYVYSILNFTLVDHENYGNCFRRSVRTHEVQHLLFDKFILKPGAPRLLDLEQNLKQRVRFTINSLGFRGEEFSRSKKRRMRVFCVGGSTTACDCNHDEETWPAQLERSLNSRGFDVEVINGGVQGWYSYQDYLRLRDEICSYEADIVLLQQGWNEEFEYSSLSLGTKWQPAMIRNVREQHHLCCPPSRLLSNAGLLSVYMTVHALLKRLIFLRNMSFSNPNRWRVLQKSDYIGAWFDNMVSSARLALQYDIVFFNINFPSLVDLRDSQADRDTYIGSTRLTELFAQYQAISKERFSKVMLTTDPLIPCLDLDQRIRDLTGTARLALFDDEMHTSPEGNRILGEHLSDILVDNVKFRERYDNPTRRVSNLVLNTQMIDEIRSKVIYNSSDIDQMIERVIGRLEST